MNLSISYHFDAIILNIIFYPVFISSFFQSSLNRIIRSFLFIFSVVTFFQFSQINTKKSNIKSQVQFLLLSVFSFFFLALFFGGRRAAPNLDPMGGVKNTYEENGDDTKINTQVHAILIYYFWFSLRILFRNRWIYLKIYRKRLSLN